MRLTRYFDAVSIKSRHNRNRILPYMLCRHSIFLCYYSSQNQTTFNCAHNFQTIGFHLINSSLTNCPTNISPRRFGTQFDCSPVLLSAVNFVIIQFYRYMFHHRLFLISVSQSACTLYITALHSFDIVFLRSTFYVWQLG